METKNLWNQIVFWSAIVIGVGLVVTGMIYVVSKQRTLPARVDATIGSSMTDSDWIKGNRNAEIIITEYSDFQCPACAFYQPILKEIISEFDDRVALVYRHFPLPMHRHAETMAYAAEAAGQQGRFFEMHDLIFENQRNWTNSSPSAVRDTISQFANGLNLDIEKFNTDFESRELRNRVDASVAEAVRSNISYTPTLFINGELLTNPNNYAEFRSLIVNKLNENTDQEQDENINPVVI